jgi:hypothetical protein
MFLGHVAIYIIINTASYLAWRKYRDNFMLWCLWVGLLGLGAILWQHLAEILFPFPSPIQFGSLVAVEVLRFMILVFLVIAGIRIFKK